MDSHGEEAEAQRGDALVLLLSYLQFCKRAVPPDSLLIRVMAQQINLPEAGALLLSK